MQRVLGARQRLRRRRQLRVHGGGGAGLDRHQAYSWKVPVRAAASSPPAATCTAAPTTCGCSQPRCHGPAAAGHQARVRRCRTTSSTAPAPSCTSPGRSTPATSSRAPASPSRKGERLRPAPRLRERALPHAGDGDHAHLRRARPPRPGALRQAARSTGASCASRLRGAPRPTVGARSRSPGSTTSGHTFVESPDAHARDAAGTTVTLRDGRFGPEHIRVPLGARVTLALPGPQAAQRAHRQRPGARLHPLAPAGRRRASRPFRLARPLRARSARSHPVTMHEFVGRAGTRRRVTFGGHVRTANGPRSARWDGRWTSSASAGRS